MSETTLNGTWRLETKDIPAEQSPKEIRFGDNTIVENSIFYHSAITLFFGIEREEEKDFISVYKEGKLVREYEILSLKDGYMLLEDVENGKEFLFKKMPPF